MLPVIPADAIGNAISIAVLVIAFIGWLVQMAGQAKAPQPQPNRPRPAGPQPNRPDIKRDKGLQSEIDAFLREVGATRKPEPKEEDDAIEILEDDELPQERKQFAGRTESAFSPVPGAPVVAVATDTVDTPSSWDREHQRRRERLISTVAERHLESTPLGAEMRKHVDQYMAESLQLRREKEQVERNLAEANAQIRAMRANTAANAGKSAVAGRASGKASIVALLKDGRTVKDAIVINEILAKPRGMRTSHR
ncbi:MAG: hypothetical protein M3552_02400 [Planctomycetota bacterium]|nr:hypothetical protein [Planctomycetaceae bacterium]MDQ3329497.1 hypothetical protein [Planctomycetota bacterium]